MKFSQAKYTKKYNKTNYKMYQFRIKKNDEELIQFLDSKKDRNNYLVSLLKNECSLTKKLNRNTWDSLFQSTYSTYVYYADVKNLNIQENIGKLPQKRQQKVNSLASENDKKLSVGVYLLLEKSLKIHHVDISKNKLKIGKNGKPYLEGNPFYISLSHSGDFVAVVLSKFPVGIDIQKTKRVNTNIFKLIFNENDSDFYINSRNKSKAFYKIWTFKESYLKMTGDGLTKPLKSVFIDYKYDFNGSFFTNYCIENKYQLSVCSKTYGVKTFKKLKI